MKKVLVLLCALIVFASVPSGAAQARSMTLSQNPWSAGLGLGVVTMDSWAMFAFEIPIQYTFKVGPGELAPGMSLMLGARSGFVTIALPIGVRYKIRILKKYPFYVWPFLDIGPTFVAKPASGGTGGFLRIGGGLSYLVHPNVELVFQPLGLGAAFSDAGGFFSYNFMVGTNFRF